MKMEMRYTVQDFDAKEPATTLALNTIQQNKQGFIFVNAKRSAEKVAEDISKKIKEKKQECLELAEKILKVLPQSTKQCQRLALCVKKGIAFHHSGLHQKQRELVEEAFRNGFVRIIACTPTLSAGVDLPAFRAIIRDVKRYGRYGMDFIPVLEYLQMAGRAGRPSFDSYGEAILISKSEQEKKNLIKQYINGAPEEIISKLAVEPVLRTYILSLIAVRLATSREGLYEFFSKTFWAYQYKNIKKLNEILDKMISLLTEWEFLQEKETLRATFLGKRIAELYLDPLTAYCIRKGILKAKLKNPTFVWLQLICNTLEMRPLLNISAKEYDSVQEKSMEYEGNFLDLESSMFEPEYEAWLQSIKTANVLQEWINEKTEESILEEFNVRPGELRTKLQIADWLFYATSEIARIEQKQSLLREIFKVRIRLKYGIKEELLPLIKFKGIGRVRARILFNNKIKDVGDIKSNSIEKISALVGKKVALKMKEQVGEKLTEKQQVL